jgi:phosphate transport system permease protein
MNSKIDVKINYRIGKSKVYQGVIILLAFIIVVPLIAIIGYIFKEGITKINWDFITKVPKPAGEIGGGIANALIGSLLIVIVASVIAIPIGILGGIYLSENKTGRLAYWSRLCVDVLQGVPSIVIGIVTYLWIVKPLGYSAYAGSIALAIMMLPILIRSTEETLKLLPASLKEAGLALGLPYHKVILKIIVPCGISGILSGVILSIARIAGETAPLIFTAFGNNFFTVNMGKPMATLPVVVYKYATDPQNELHGLAWGASLILLFSVLSLNIITKITTRKWNIQL